MTTKRVAKPKFVYATMNPRTLVKVREFAETEYYSVSSAIECLIKTGLRAHAAGDDTR